MGSKDSTVGAAFEAGVMVLTFVAAFPLALLRGGLRIPKNDGKDYTARTYRRKEL